MEGQSQTDLPHLPGGRAASEAAQEKARCPVAGRAPGHCLIASGPADLSVGFCTVGIVTPCCNSMGSRAFCDTRTGGMLIGYARVFTQETREESPEKRRRTPLTTFWAAETQLGTHSLCQEPSETGALSPSTLVRNAPLSVQNRTNLSDTLPTAVESQAGPQAGTCLPFSGRKSCASFCRRSS